jgi:selenide,water dikinase
MQDVNLTSFSRWGGCSSKVDAGLLAQLCAMPEVRAASLPGHQPDDAAILPIGGGHAIVTSIDFHGPVVSDAVLSGEIAARHALSDIFACGVYPMYANVVLVLPYGKRAHEIGAGLMRGVSTACKEEDCAIVGGHTMFGETPLVGLSVLSVASMNGIKRKSGARAGDVLMLTKPLGTGIAVAANQQDLFDARDYAAALEVMRASNKVGARLGGLSGVSAMTDITGFGLLGHSCEIAECSGVTLRINAGDIPLLPGVMRAVRDGAAPTLCDANLNAYAAGTSFQGTCRRHERLAFSDPQTNGGLLVCVHPESRDEVADVFAAAGVPSWAIGVVGTRCASGVLVDVR